MGGSMKGHMSNGNRGRPYGLMLLLAFGAAFFGVMLLHKLRERRVFNLLVKEKDRDLLSLQILFQKERDYYKEVQRKNEEMKAKMYSLGTQKMELESRILEMQSTISSLKDEQRSMESALEEKQNEVKLLQERERDSNKEGISLTEILKHKEAEIEDLKRRLEYPINVWSVSTDDPSNPSVNLSIAWKDRSEARGIKEEATAAYRDSDENSKRDGDGDGSGNESTNHPDGRENGVGFAGRREMTGDRSQRLENSHDDEFTEAQEKKTEDSQDGEGFGTGEAKNITIATETISNHGGEVFKTKDEYSDVEGTEHGIAGIGQLEKLNSEGQRFRVNSRGGMKLEIPGNSESGAGYRVRGKHGSTSKMKGKRWTMPARIRRHENSRNSENNGYVSMTSRRFSREALESEMSKRHWERENAGLKMRDESGQENGKLDLYDNHQKGQSLEIKNDDQQVGLQGGEDSPKEVREALVSTDVKLLKPQNFENVSVKVDINQHTETRQEMEKPQHTPDVVGLEVADVKEAETDDIERESRSKLEEADETEF